jgi:hypothetical protein
MSLNISTINRNKFVAKFDEILARGLSSGMGKRDGQMCIEAAVCAALDLPHGDEPQCVATTVRTFKIALNDSNWSSPQARAAGLRDLGIAQVGSLGVVDDNVFVQKIAEKTIRVLIPALFREVFPNNQACLAAAKRCEDEGTEEAARAAEAAARDAWDAGAAARAAWDAGTAARDAWDAGAAARAAWDAGTAARAAAGAARDAWAARAASWAAAGDAARAAGAAAEAAAWAIRAARDAAGAAAGAARDKYLVLSAKLALEVLREMGSPGVGWL